MLHSKLNTLYIPLRRTSEVEGLREHRSLSWTVSYNRQCVDFTSRSCDAIESMEWNFLSNFRYQWMQLHLGRRHWSNAAQNGALQRTRSQTATEKPLQSPENTFPPYLLAWPHLICPILEAKRLLSLSIGDLCNSGFKL